MPGPLTNYFFFQLLSYSGLIKMKSLPAGPSPDSISPGKSRFFDFQVYKSRDSHPSWPVTRICFIEHSLKLTGTTDRLVVVHQVMTQYPACVAQAGGKTVGLRPHQDGSGRDGRSTQKN